MDTLVDLSIDLLQRGQFQPRRDFDSQALQELAASIQEQGIIEPIIVRPVANNRYEIIAGERRWRAAQLAKYDKVSCVVRHYSDAQAAEVTLIENIQRENLNPIEEAQALARLFNEFSYTHDEIAIAVGKSRTKITNVLRLLLLDERVQQLLIEKKLTEGHGKVLAGLALNQQYGLANDCVKGSWSVRQIEKYAQQLKQQQQSECHVDPDLQRLERITAEHFNAEVKLEKNALNKKGGWLKIKYYDHETLEGILEKMTVTLE